MWLVSGAAVAVARLAAAALIRPLALELPYATGAAVKRKKKKKEREKDFAPFLSLPPNKYSGKRRGHTDVTVSPKLGPQDPYPPSLRY